MSNPCEDHVILQPLSLSHPVTAAVTVPGSKSYTIRALLLAAMTPKPDGAPVRVLNPLFSDDSQAILACLKQLGIKSTIHQDENSETTRWIEVHNSVTEIQAGDYELNADLSAATLRFLIALAAVIPGRQTLLGKPGLNKRPVRDLVDSLRAIGADIEYLDREGYPPVRVNSSRIEAHRFEVSGATSSQYISALMMIAPLIQASQAAQANETAQPIIIALTDDPVSTPYLEMTMAIMRDFGVMVEHQQYRQFSIAPGQTYQTQVYAVEPDASSMAYLLAIAALTGSSITIKHLNPNSVQADMRFAQILKDMGHRVEWRGDALTLTGNPKAIRPITVNMEDCPDQAQTLAVLAAFAPGVTRIEGLKSLRVKETDRIASTAQELTKLGIRTEAEPDALVIHGGQPHAARIATYDDHRMAMAFAVAGARLSGLEIEDPPVVNKTYPEFWEALRQLGMGVQRVQASDSTSSVPSNEGESPILAGTELKAASANSANLAHPNNQKIVLIGFMGAGKSAVGQRLADLLDFDFVDMDAHIVARSGRGSVTEIFDRQGEPHFRALEELVACELASAQQMVIATGGGAVMSDRAMRALAQSATVIFLETPLATVYQRIGSDQNRPLMRNKAQFEALFAMRQPLYAQAAQVTIETTERSSAQVAAEILQALGLSVENHSTVCAV